MLLSKGAVFASLAQYEIIIQELIPLCSMLPVLLVYNLWRQLSRLHSSDHINYPCGTGKAVVARFYGMHSL